MLNKFRPLTHCVKLDNAVRNGHLSDVSIFFDVTDVLVTLVIHILATAISMNTFQVAFLGDLYLSFDKLMGQIKSIDKDKDINRVWQ